VTIHPSAPPNHLAADELRVRPGPDRVSLSIDPARAGWRYLSFTAVALGRADRLDVGGPGSETAVVVIGGGGLTVACAPVPELQLDGRRTVFDSKPWAAYLPDGCHARVTAHPCDEGGRVVVVTDSPHARRVFELTGLTRHVDLERTLSSALETVEAVA
jgi:5-deoxy-D-glucuronate isomerase